jgi:hypothetical protein
MKNIIALIAFAAVTLTASIDAKAQFVTVLTGGTVTNAGSTNLNGGSGFYVDCRHQDNVQLFWSFNNMTAATASNAILRFIRAADASGTKDDSNWVGNITLACNGLSTVQVATNIAVTGVPYLKLTAVENTNTPAGHQITNMTIGYTVKQIGR